MTASLVFRLTGPAVGRWDLFRMSMGGVGAGISVCQTPARPEQRHRPSTTVLRRFLLKRRKAGSYNAGSSVTVQAAYWATRASLANV